MAFVVAAIWTAKPRGEDRIARILEVMSPLSRQEPGCLYYQAHRSPDNPRVFFLYEQYRGREGYEAHMASAHFEQYVRGEAIPNLESRERAFYETLDV
ncbi:MAG TPA: putative quinol monooxygenase [Chloroflexota bacterium]|nr:putative quinol monooxygenase [Chloroflexota bacterium]